LKNNSALFAKRKNNLIFFIFFIFSIITLRFFFIQIIKYESFESASDRNSSRLVKTNAPRGFITDRNGRVIVSNRSTFSIEIYPVNFNDSSFNFNLFYSIIDKAQKRSNFLVKKENFIDSINYIKKYFRKGKFKPVSIINYIDFQTKALLSEYKIHFPGLSFKSNPARYYSKDLRLSHVLGYLRPVPIHKVNKEGYDINDIYGVDGIESKFEDKLRGKKGMENRIIDAHGLDYGLDNEKDNIPSISGDNIKLTIDYDLQYTVEQLIEQYTGSVICMDPLNGEVLAMASSPNYSLSEFIGPLKHEIWNDWTEKKILLNRATVGQYQPGSLHKLVAYIMFMDKNLISNDLKVDCDGKFELEDFSNPGKPQIYRCWKEDGHGEVDINDAIKKSCNVYFYDMILKYQEKDNLIIDELYEYSEKLGFNNKTGIEIFEQKGRIPDSNWMNINEGKRWPKRGSMPNLVIGQGANAITPLQAINAINLIATNGNTFKPRLVMESSLIPVKSSIKRHIWINLQDALYSVVNEEGGTAYSLRKDDVIVRGKTGTAQSKSNSSTEDLISWFAGYIEYNEKLMSIVVMIENTNTKTKGLAKEISNEIINYQIKQYNDK
tara:strand:- start:1339 stop:3156 length:1818 start_codon:yes stop_codon:yes gene_type:complete